MFRVQLHNFRCFAESEPLEVKPITFLVGENSAGKTTFLAAVRQLLESFIRSPQNMFNRDPYYLGGFDQIAHYRGGRPGRAKSFSLELMIPASPEGTSRARHVSAPTGHKFTFVKGSPHPELSEYKFTTPEVSAVLDLSEKTTLKIERIGATPLQFTPARLPHVSLLRKDLSYLRYVFDEVYFGKDRPRDPETPQEKEAERSLKVLFERYRESTRFVMRRTFASAPVRTQPLRIYTPSEIVASSEGSHVPLEMARQKINSPTEWTSMHEKLARFGQHSGLFDDIDIRGLGKRDGDPFQVLVRTKGPPMNLVDVGYGVSQALPIIYQLEQSRQNDAMLLQQPEVHLHPRAQAELGTLIARLSKQRSTALYMVETHSDYIIDRVRMDVARGALDPKNVTIIYFDKQAHEVEAKNIYLSDKGEILDAPPNFRSFFLREHARLLGV
jgi:AAA ATPase domain/AAA domain